MTTPTDDDGSTAPPPTSAPEPQAARADRGARVRRGLARGATGLLVLGAAAGVAVAGARFAPPHAPVPVELPRVEVEAAATDLVCPGALRLPTEPEPGEDVAYDPQFDPAPGASVAAVRAATVVPGDGGARAASGRLTDLAGGATAVDLEPLGAGAVVTVQDPQDATVVHVEATEDGPGWAAGAVGVTTASGDLRGLAAASCQLAAADTWLVGGSTAVGSSARLVLQNPGRTAATVTVRLWGPSGEVELTGAPTFLVPPGTERVVLLEGVAAEQSRIVTQVTSSGGIVSAYVQDSQLRGLVPAGVDHVVAGAGPATRQVVPGVSVAASQVAGSDPSVLRLLAPDEDTTAEVTFLGPDGVVPLPGATEVELDAGTVLDLPLSGLAPGDYTAVVDSGSPLVAGALLARGGAVGPTVGGSPSQLPLDRAWAPAVGTTGAGVLAVPPGGDGRLVLGVAEATGTEEGSGPAEATVEVLDEEGVVVGTSEVRVDEGSVSSMALDDLLEDPADDGSAAADPEVAVVVVRTSDPRVSWAVVLLAQDALGDMVSVLAPVPPPAVPPDVAVRAR